MREPGAIDPGRLRHRVMLQSRTAAADGQGGEADEQWSDMARLSVMIETGAAERLVDEDRDGVRAQSMVTLRYRNDVLPGMRFLYRGRVLMIRTVSDPGERFRWLVCACEEETR